MPIVTKVTNRHPTDISKKSGASLRPKTIDSYLFHTTLRGKTGGNQAIEGAAKPQ
jgi:hypothetical protein